jgi:uncharacterized phage protein (TIGR02218 family)
VFDYQEGAGALLEQNAMRQANLFKVVRADATVIRLTDHDSDLEYGGDTFTPVGGGNLSDFHAVGSLKVGSSEILCVFSSSQIALDDVRAKLYERAQVTIYLVDWMFPWSDPIEEMEYRVGKVTFDESSARFELLTKAYDFQKTTGFVASETCDYVFTQGLCEATPTTYSPTVVGIVTQRHAINSSVTLPTETDDFYNDAWITWTSGNNDGHVSYIKDYTATGRILEFYTPTPFDIQVGDGFTLTPYCDHTFAECIAYGERVHFGGNPNMPGEESLVAGPDTV